MQSQVFTIAQVSSRTFGGLLLVLLSAIVVIALVGLVAVRSVRSTTFIVGDEGLRIQSSAFSDVIPFSELRTDAAARVDFAADPELAPRWRTFGIGVGQYRAGWFRLRNREKALLHVTTNARVVRIPTTRGYDVLLSPEDPDGFLRALKSAAR
jgi:hypothetical protein